MHKFEHTIGCT